MVIRSQVSASERDSLHPVLFLGSSASIYEIMELRTRIIVARIFVDGEGNEVDSILG